MLNVDHHISLDDNTTSADDFLQDEQNKDQKVSKKKTLKLRMRSKLLLAFGAVGLMTCVASAIALYGYFQIKQNFSLLSQNKLPKLIGSANLLSQTTDIMVWTNKLANAQDHQAKDTALNQLNAIVPDLLKVLNAPQFTNDNNENSQKLLSTAKAFSSKLSTLDKYTSARIEQAALRKQNLSQVFQLSEEISGILTKKIDDAHFELMLGGEDASQQAKAVIEKIVKTDMPLITNLLAFRVELNAVNTNLIGYLLIDEYSKAQIFDDNLTTHANRMQEILTELKANKIELSFIKDADNFLQRVRKIKNLRSSGSSSFAYDVIKRQKLTFELIDLQKKIEDKLLTVFDDQVFQFEIDTEEASGKNAKIINNLLNTQVDTLKANLDFVAKINGFIALLVQGALETDLNNIVPIQDKVTAMSNSLRSVSSHISTDQISQKLLVLLAFAENGNGIISNRLSELSALTKAKQTAEQVLLESQDISQIVKVLVGQTQKLAEEKSKEIETEILISERLLIIITAVAILLVASIGYFVVNRSLATPLAEIVRTIRKLAKGNTDVTVSNEKRHDEIGDLSRAVVVFRDNHLKRQQLEKKQKEFIMQGQARQMKTDELITEFRQIVHTAISSVNSNIDEMRTAAEAMTGIAKQTSSEAERAAATSEQASTNVQAVGAAAEEMAMSNSEISKKVVETTDVVQTANQHAQETNEKITMLANAAENIGQVVGLISDIAEKTNLLALNATIEAARAGEAGKGFAIVASEVKDLASQTAKATEEISSQVLTIQNSTTEAVNAIELITKTMSHVNEYATAVSSAIHQQGAATSEIASSASQASSGTEDVAKVIVQVQSSSVKTSEASNQVLNGSHEVNKQNKHLEKVIDQFLQNVAVN